MLISDKKQKQVQIVMINVEILDSMNEADLIKHSMEGAFEERDEVMENTCANIAVDDTYLKSI